MTGKTQKHRYHVALFVETSHEFGRSILRGIRDYEASLTDRWSFFLLPYDQHQEFPALSNWPCSGIIARTNSLTEARRLQKKGVPMVLLDPSSGNLFLHDDTIPVVSSDTNRIVRMGYNHLKGCGCRTFAFVHSMTETIWSTQRAEAFRRLLEREGTECHIFPVQDPKDSWTTKIRKLGRWLKNLPKPVGVFAAMDQRGIQVIEACKEMYLSIPDDVAIISVDNDPLLCELCEPTLSSIALDAYGAGKRAARLLHLQMAGKPLPEDTQILVAPTHISRRESTEIGFDRDPIIAEARRFIFTQISNPNFQMPDISRHCGVSRRLLESRFAQSTGRTLLQIVTETRMEHACTLLRDTDFPVSKISDACGYSDPNYFTKSFRKHFQMPPNQYRESCRNRYTPVAGEEEEKPE